MYYVYILHSLQDGSYYTGLTTDLKARIEKHNRGEVKYSSQKKPWVLAWYSGFKDKHRAAHFEQYLKQGSGFAFARRHLL